jgi:Uma2 family endonuclease
LRWIEKNLQLWLIIHIFGKKSHMQTTANIPATLKERLEYGDVLRVPASWEEFLDVLETCPYRIEYDAGEILSFMGYGTEEHEKLALRIGHLLLSLLDESLYECYGSNLALHIPSLTPRYYNADCVAVKGDPQKVELRPGIAAIANPILIAEVLSDSTRDFDLGTKFAQYRQIPSLQQILFIESTARLVVSHTRLSERNEWLLQEFYRPADAVPILGQEGSILLKDLYRKIN